MPRFLYGQPSHEPPVKANSTQGCERKKQANFKPLRVISSADFDPTFNIPGISDAPETIFSQWAVLHEAGPVKAQNAA